MSDVVISIENLGKRYRYGGAAPLSYNLRQDIGDWVRGLWPHSSQKLVVSSQSPSTENRQLTTGTHPSFHQIHETHLDADPNYFWALKDVNLEIKQGEVVGIIGRNGAGKSTLLKILSRITPPTTGSIKYQGRVSSLLEVGTGFHRELTGRENIFLNGSILGMKRSEIARQFDEIVAFAEVEKFIDTPVKFYSSGMYVRLAFAVAAHLEPEILVVDEVLAVGDAEFQKKCLGRMGEVARQGRTVLFVSHNMGAIIRLCQTCVWINAGSVRRQGPPREVVNAYLKEGIAETAEKTWSSTEAPGDNTVRLRGIRICQPERVPNVAIEITKPFVIEIETEVLVKVEGVAVGFRILSSDGQVLLHTGDVMAVPLALRSPGLYRHCCLLPAFVLNPGTYFLSVAADIPHSRIIFTADNVLSWNIEAVSTEMGRYDPKAWTGVIGAGLPSWTVEPAST